MRKLIAGLAVAFPLAFAGCNGSTVNTSALQTALTSSVGQSLEATIVNQAFPSLSATIAKGAAAASADIQLAAYWLPWVDMAVDMFGPSLGMTPAQIAAADATEKTLLASLQNPPSDTASLIADLGTFVQGVQADLKPVTG